MYTHASKLCKLHVNTLYKPLDMLHRPCLSAIKTPHCNFWVAAVQQTALKGCSSIGQPASACALMRSGLLIAHMVHKPTILHAASCKTQLHLYSMRIAKKRRQFSSALANHQIQHEAAWMQLPTYPSNAVNESQSTQKKDTLPSTQ